MIPEMFFLPFLPPAAVAVDPELPPLPLWVKLGLAGAAALVTAFALTLA